MIRRKDDDIEMVEIVWGLKPYHPSRGPVINIRSEGRSFPTDRRCLVAATEFFIRERSEPHARWRFALAEGDSFYFAGLWHPASEDWPEAYALLTTAANPEVAPVHDRQVAVILRASRTEWLDGIVSGERLLRPLPAGTFRRARVG